MAAVLIIDDDEEIRDLWADILSEDGFEVHVAPCGVQGVEIARTRHIDVVVTDMIMPQKDGIETLLEIRSVRPEAKILVVSGGGTFLNTSFLEFADRLGADATLQKPVDVDTIRRCVAQLAKKNHRRQYRDNTS